MADAIEDFMASSVFAVVGASNDPEKYGHKCFASLLAYGRKAYPVNPRATKVLDHDAYPTLVSLPEKVSAVSIITPPAITEKVIDDAIAAGAKIVWMQPGAESDAAIEKAEKAGLRVIAGGPCLLVEIRLNSRR